jgi:hypothetical protein
VDANVEMYVFRAMFRALFVAHGRQLRVVYNQELH